MQAVVMGNTIEVKALVNHPGMYLKPAAADSLTRYERDHGILSLNDAWRSEDTQRGLVRRWNEGGPTNRPPYLYLPAFPSPHMFGEAIDTSEYDRFAEYCGEYGWRFNIPSDPVHAIYEQIRDTHYNEKDDEMTPEQDERLKNVERILANLQNSVGDPEIGILKTSKDAADRSGNAASIASDVRNWIEDKKRGINDRLTRIEEKLNK
jgi:hypothetical protein